MDLDADGDLDVLVGEQDGGLHFYRNLDIVNTTAVEMPATPTAFSLRQNYPNPFNSSTTIRFEVPRAAAVDLAIYNVGGQKLATLVSGRREGGSHVLRWDGRDDSHRLLASGVYVCRLVAGDQVQMRKLMLLR